MHALLTTESDLLCTVVTGHESVLDVLTMHIHTSFKKMTFRKQTLVVLKEKEFTMFVKIGHYVALPAFHFMQEVFSKEKILLDS